MTAVTRWRDDPRRVPLTSFIILYNQKSVESMQVADLIMGKEGGMRDKRTKLAQISTKTKDLARMFPHARGASSFDLAVLSLYPEDHACRGETSVIYRACVLTPRIYEWIAHHWHRFSDSSYSSRLLLPVSSFSCITRSNVVTAT